MEQANNLDNKNTEEINNIPAVEINDNNPDDQAVKEIEINESDESLKSEQNNIEIPAKKSRLGWIKSKPFIISVSIALIVVLLLAVPLTRYQILGLFVKGKYSLNVIDSQTGSPVIGADVVIKNKHYTTNSQGAINISTNVGNQSLNINKKYYATYNAKILIPLSQKKPQVINLVATGRMVSIKVINKINKSPVTDILVTADGTSTKTDASGNASIVLSASNQTTKGIISGKGYNTQNVTINTSTCLLYTSPSPRDGLLSRMPSSA